MNGTAEDVIERDALSLLNELTEIPASEEPTAPAPTILPAQESPVPLHTIPQPRSENISKSQSENISESQNAKASNEERPLDDFNAA
jgi:hypothetical protein